MDPIAQMAMLGGGLALQGIGAIMNHSAQKEYNQHQQNQIGLEQKVSAQRYQAEQLDADRRRMETFRVAQRMRATALTNATSQGGQFGSGLQGGYGQIAGQSGVNLLGINQNAQISGDIFGLNSQISQERIGMAQSNMDSQTAQGLSSFGSSMSNASSTFGKFFSGYSNGTPSPAGGMGLYSGMQTGSMY